MFDLTRFTLKDMAACGIAVRSMAAEASSLEALSERLARHLYDNLRDAVDGQRQCAWVRVFATPPGATLQPHALPRAVPSSAFPPVSGLTLLAAAWGSPS